MLLKWFNALKVTESKRRPICFSINGRRKSEKHNYLFQLNSDVTNFQRKFVAEVRKHDELERKLRYIAAETTRDGFSIPDAPDDTKVPNPRESIELEVNFYFALFCDGN